MPTAHSAGEVTSDFYTGNRCMLLVSGRRFLVELLEVGADTVRVTFPLRNFPLGGMRVDLEFHDTEGYTQYNTVVVSGPSKINDGIILSLPDTPRRNRHRSALRVPTDLTAQIKDQVHVRRYDADVLDMSEGGALVSSHAPFDFDTTVEMSLSLPGETIHTILGQVVHMNAVDDGGVDSGRLFGIRFLTCDPLAANALARYVQRRLKELHAEG